VAKSQNETLTYEKVMAMFQETALRFKETDRKFQETREQIKETNKRIGELGNRFGEIAEHLVAPGIVEKFNNIGYNFDDISTRGREYKDPKTRQHLAEVDIVLENRSILIAVEVKSKANKQDIKEHLARMNVLRRIADSMQDTRKYRGAIASAIITKETRNFAHKSGFYVIEQSGDTMKLDIPKGFVPRDW